MLGPLILVFYVSKKRVLVIVIFLEILSPADNLLTQNLCWLLYGALATTAVTEKNHVAISLGLCECLFLLDFLGVFL
jgi:hypothetical protein